MVRGGFEAMRRNEILHRLRAVPMRSVNYAHECTYEECIIAQCGIAHNEFVRNANISSLDDAFEMQMEKLTEKTSKESVDNRR